MTKVTSTKQRKIFYQWFLFLALMSSSNFLIASSSKRSEFNKELLMSRFASWGIDPEQKSSAINLKESWRIFRKKKDIVVAVIDTGIQFDHPFLKENLYFPGSSPNKTKFGVDFSSSKINFVPEDHHGHGTHVAGIIKSINPGVKILSLKYYNPKASGQQNLDATIKALKYAVDQNVDIINYSGGGPEASRQELNILKKAMRKGILVIAAAGNERSNIDQKSNAYYPASYGLDNIITVNAHDQNLQIIPSSNYGKNSVDIAAPGYRIRSSIPNSKAAYMTGTSQATAFVTGVASLLKANFPKLDAKKIKNIIISSSQKIKTLQGKVLGGGKLDASNAMKLALRVHDKLSIPQKREVANK